MIYVLAISVFLKLYSILNIYQQSHYKIKEYFLYFIKNILFYSLSLIIPIVICIVSNNLIVDIIFSVFVLFYSLLFIKFKVKLKFSKRIIRLLIIAIMYFSLIYCLDSVRIYLFIVSEFSIIPILFIDKIISKLINRKYIVLAKNKIEKYNGKKIIITGSYGKTSTKLLFNQVMNIFTTSIATPKSYNTPLGVASFINDEAIDVYENVVLEYGASKVNDIKELLNIARPDVAVVTEIGFMHMNSFKDINNVVNEKMSLINDCEIAILNYDNKYIREYKKNNPIILSYGFEYGDFNAKNVVDGSFDFYYKDKFIHHFDTFLIGKHQILNLLAPLSYAYYLGYDFSYIAKSLKFVKVDNKRLELKKYKNRIILDDSFNSNYIGFTKALDVLGACKCKRFVITPGLVELGNYNEYIHSILGNYISKNADAVILVGRQMYKYLINKGIDVYTDRSFKRAYKRYLKLSKNNMSALLIENDLPDIYIKRGIIF